MKLREREGQGVDPGRSLKGHLWMVDGGWWYTFPYAGNNSTKGESVQATLSATLLEKKSTKPLNNNIYFDEEDRAQKYMNMKDEITL